MRPLALAIRLGGGASRSCTYQVSKVHRHAAIRLWSSCRSLAAPRGSVEATSEVASAAQPPPPQLSTLPSVAPSPREGAVRAGEAGLSRGTRSSIEIFETSAYGGLLLGAGGAVFATVAAGSPALAAAAPGAFKVFSAAVFPSGLAMILGTGQDLLTSNFAYHLLPFVTHPHRNANAKTALRVWVISAAGNAAGSVVAAAFAATCIFAGQPAVAAWAGTLAVAKTSLPFGIALVKGIGANFLVNVAVHMAGLAQSIGAKVAVAWIPITAFVALGLEHAVANMFLVPLGIFLGADVSWEALLLHNLVPVTLGNLGGAALFVHMFRHATPAAAVAAAAARTPASHRGHLARWWHGRY